LLPEPLIETLGLQGKLAGSAQNRIKTIKLRGEISQGVVADPAKLLPGWGHVIPIAGTDYTDFLVLSNMTRNLFQVKTLTWGLCLN
jgi:hypothetical protein